MYNSIFDWGSDATWGISPAGILIFDTCLRGNHLSNATCLMQVFFKSDE